MHLSERQESWIAAAFVFAITAGLSAFAISDSERSRVQLERDRIAALARVNAHAIEQEIRQSLSAAFALAALIRQGRGQIANFEATAKELLTFYPGVTSLRLAPGGVIREIYPLAGNEGALGLDLLNDPARAFEVQLALATGRMTLAGPFDLASGGLSAVGRLPVYLGEERDFWGFAVATIRIPDALGPGRLSDLVARGLSYRLWRVHPVTGGRQIIDTSAGPEPSAPVSQRIELPNAVWILSLAPVAGWADPAGLTAKIALGLGLSTLLAWLSKLLLDLRSQRRRLTALVGERTSELAEREADLNRAQAVARVGSWVYEFAAERISWSAEASRILGLPRDPVLSYKPSLKRVERLDRKTLVLLRKGVLSGLSQDVELRVWVAGHRRWLRVRSESERDTTGQLMRCLGTVQDITERKEAEEEIYRLAYYDPLTGLANRRLVLDRLDCALARSRRTGQLGALLFLDLDNFKYFNDRFGHDVGDEVLRELAIRLCSAVRKQESVARLGGDELVVMLEDLGSDTGVAAVRAKRVGERLLAALVPSFKIAGRSMSVAASVGIAMFGHRDEPGASVLKRADQAMYRAKSIGGRCLEADASLPHRRCRSRPTTAMRLGECDDRSQTGVRGRLRACARQGTSGQRRAIGSARKKSK